MLTSSCRRPMSSMATRVIRFVNPQGQVCVGQTPPSSSSSAQLLQSGDGLGSLTIKHEKEIVQKLLPPVVPTQVIGIGLNYRNHAKETNMAIPKHPVVFFKSLGSVIAHGEPIVIPRIAADPLEVDYECELAVVLKEDCRNATIENALSFVGGYTCANDVSARRWQSVHKGGGQWCRAKSFDTFCPLGPCLVPPSVIPDPQALKIETYLNGECVQSSSTQDMIFSVAELISLLSQDTTLPAGTVILTGTPEGVGYTRKPPLYLKPGDKVEIRIENIGSLVNPVVAASAL
ncbi:fumarylacetoacetate (FAA) hydrolase [Thraustotheca clavata]|uniref:Fumarylacetoacetate (FAA) hydrolase n=1 Tax=Thraustotheca clavata TaxID=74557 RepID=A0A1W0A527_9STRA|nr:fumarylacetoacetate (FAA) hydrolase [Thraustotheca clavata]